MRIFYVVDGRSPTAVPWARYFARVGHDVHVISTRLCPPEEFRPAKLYLLGAPMALDGRGARGALAPPARRMSLPRIAQSRLGCAAHSMWDWVGPVVSVLR